MALPYLSPIVRAIHESRFRASATAENHPDFLPMLPTRDFAPLRFFSFPAVVVEDCEEKRGVALNPIPAKILPECTRRRNPHSVSAWGEFTRDSCEYENRSAMRRWPVVALRWIKFEMLRWRVHSILW